MNSQKKQMKTMTTTEKNISSMHHIHFLVNYLEQKRIHRLRKLVKPCIGPATKEVLTP